MGKKKTIIDGLFNNNSLIITANEIFLAIITSNKLNNISAKPTINNPNIKKIKGANNSIKEYLSKIFKKLNLGFT